MESQVKKEFLETIQNLKQEKSQIDIQLTQIKSQLSKDQTEPARLKKQTDMVRNALNTMKVDLQSVEKKLVECDSIITEKQRQKDIDSKELSELGEAIDVARTNHEQKGQQIDELINQIRDEDIKSGQLSEEKVKFDLENERIKSEKSEILQQETILNREYRLVRKDLKHMSDNVDQLKSTIPVLEGRLTGLHHDIKSNNETLARETKALASLETEIEINISQFLNQEKFEADQKQVLTLMKSQKEEMERQIDMWNEETKKMSRTLKILNSQKEFKSREASQASLNEKNTKELLKIKELSIIDLTKKSNDLSKKLKQFSLLYDVIKTERNKLVNMLQSSAQAISELKEKLRILTNEINILKNENGSKDRSLNNERMEHEHSKYERDNLKTETNKHYNIYNTKQSKIDQQVMEIDKLNSIINKIEREMLKLKRNYELGVELRNYYGVQLIDRNDELCIFYEKSNIQEATLRKGNDALNKLDEDKKTLLVHFQEVCRQIDLVRKHIPEVPSLLEKIEELRNNLRDEKESIRELCEQLENPSNLSRWRPLEGEDLTKDQLEAKLNLLQSKLDQKKKQVLDKQLVLEEITSLSEKLKLQAKEGRQEALNYANKIHDIQCEIRDITASLLASVAELSMYKSMCIKLEEERDIIKEIVDNTIMVIDQGVEPSNDLISSFYKNENNKILEKDRIENMKRLKLKNDIDLNRLNTTAEPRPNSYVPDDLPLPKPYGGFAPFKPSVSGTNMRHIKKPKPPNIEI